ncbi:hypothetical protein VNI00_002017 [Paramarasmius palmivorus]|uniref:Conserved oligomeric Golgi complex subunit 1 n=1 Tax=Paramarasmius palmivorus TaxID=297713 RepID=A0AAW0E648_9AGAR
MISTTRKVSASMSSNVAPAMDRSSSHSSSTSSKLPEDIDPDELFNKYTVSEVKVVQQRLRRDADAKQEELRQMVGERYRDLLQASTSIISIAQSSKRVIHALEDTKTAILSQEEDMPTRHANTKDNDDVHLNMLQNLSAHIKLLLDVPEHLWRLMEKKKYFTAAWLFLLSRVVHRALIREDERDEEAWNSQGIDILDQFPLVQRQWEHVSSFRQQIIVRAKQSLQEYTTSTEETCATLLTLHLLESRPLTDTLAIFLEKRSKALGANLFQDSKSALTPSLSRRNKFAEPTTDRKSTTGKVSTVKEVKDNTIAALDCISRTVCTIHGVLGKNDSSESLIQQVLGYIQSDPSDPPASSLPPDLKLSTHDLLMSLPSSAHFLLLPQNLRSYRPYVDLASSSSKLSQNTLHAKVDEWFKKSIASLQIAIERWLDEVHSVKNVWSVRSAVITWIQRSRLSLDSHKVTSLEAIVNETCQRRIVELWKLSLEETERSFHTRLTEIVDAFSNNEQTGIGMPCLDLTVVKASVLFTDASPIHLLFRAPPLPTASQVGAGSLEATFQKYRSSLSKQLLGRTPLLDDLLKGVETCAAGVHHDFTQVLSGCNDNSLALVRELTKTYYPLAQALCSGITSSLHSVADSLTIDNRASQDALIFVGQAADELCRSSSFIEHILCEPDVAQVFRTQCTSLFELSLKRWIDFIVSSATTRYRDTRAVVPRKHICDSPSPELIQALLSLASELNGLGISRNISRRVQLADQTLRAFVSRLLENGGIECTSSAQALYDLVLLRQLSELCNPGSSSPWDMLRKQLDAEINKTSENDTRIDARISEYLARTQVLFAALLPRPNTASSTSTSLLPLGAPTTGKDIPSALELADSGARFGLLLVN